MANLLYHSIEPENNASSYTEFATADFVLTGAGRKLVADSVRLEGTIHLEKGGGVGPKTIALIAADAGHWKVDNQIGMHAICESITTEVQSAGNIEHLASYPRYVKMVAASSKDSNDMMSADMVVEGRGPVGSNGEYAIEPVACLNIDAGGAGLQTVKDPAFSLRLMQCLNRMSGNYSFDKHGYIKMSINFARVNQLVFGTDCDSTMSYELQGLRLSYKTVPDDKVDEKLLMRSYFSTKSTMQSQSASIQSRVPSDIVLGCSVCFLKLANESSPTENSHALEKLPNVDAVRMLFADTENRFISYSITETSDLLDRGIKSLAYSGHTSATQLKLKGNDSYIIGSDFASPVSLRNQKFTLSLDTTSTVLSGSPYIVYQYFHTILSL